MLMIDIDEVKAYSEKHTLSEARKYFGYSKGYLSGIAKKNGFHFLKEIRDKEMKEFIVKNGGNMTRAQIAKALGIGYEKVYKLCLELDVKPINARKDAQSIKKEVVSCLVDNGFSLACIARAFGVSRQRIHQIYSSGD